jgi:hypothetical protein
VGAGIVTLRVGTRLVGLRADTPWTLNRLRRLLAAWIDDGHPDIPWVFDVRLDPDRHTPARVARGRADEHTPSGRFGMGPRPVPQLRVGQILMARSRTADDVLRALTSVLGGVLARQDDTGIWSAMRTFRRSDRIVLVDARPPAFSADPALTRAGISEVATWSVLIDGTTVHVPPPLDPIDWAAADLEPPPMTWRTGALAGMVAFDPDPREHEAVDGPAAALSRFAARHPSRRWFATVEQLIREGRVTVTSERSIARQRIAEVAGP